MPRIFQTSTYQSDLRAVEPPFPHTGILHRIVAIHTVGGGLFGFCFPLVAWVVDSRLRHLALSFSVIIFMHHSNALHWIIDLAPFVLSATFAGVGYQRAVVELQNRKLCALAYHDTLTRLANRRLFQARLKDGLQVAARLGHRLGILFLDLDHFKVVNDSMGHRSGDALLLQVADRLLQCAHTGDTVARTGGDEFMVIITDPVEAEGLASAAARFVASMRASFLVEGQDVFVTCSVGACAYPDAGGNPEDLQKNVDIALYRAKQQGRNGHVVFAEEMAAQAREAFSMQADLRKAITNGEFALYYQPQFDPERNCMLGMEALVRWLHPDKGLVQPLSFIPIAEETGLIVPIGLWVLRTACLQTREWHRMGYTRLCVSVNLSVRQLRQDDLVSQVAETLRETGIDPKCLQLEITESVAMEDMERTMKIMTRLRKLGVKLALDDFGTGYSSLNVLRQLPVSTLKMDQSFIHGVTRDSRDAAIARNIIALAHSLEMGVVAEGVETEEQRRFLAAQQCDVIQGYLFGRPMPANEFAGLLATEAARGMDRAA